MTEAEPRSNPSEQLRGASRKLLEAQASYRQGQGFLDDSLNRFKQAQNLYEGSIQGNLLGDFSVREVRSKQKIIRDRIALIQRALRLGEQPSTDRSPVRNIIDRIRSKFTAALDRR